MSELHEPSDAGPSLPENVTTNTNEFTNESTLESLPAAIEYIAKNDPIAAPSLQQQAQGLTNQVLQFLSTASNETIGACLVGLGASTYIVLGRVGLVLMGVVGGVVLHATWEGHLGVDGETKRTEEIRRREVGLDVVKRALAWRAGKDEEHMAMERIEVAAGQKLNYNGFRPETREALTEFTDAAIRDYVK
jgi:hypothetical protein